MPEINIFLRRTVPRPPNQILTERILLRQLCNHLPCLLHVILALDHHGDDLRDLIHIVLFHPACSHCRSAKANTTCDKRRTGIVGDRILVTCHVRIVETLLQLFSADSCLCQVYQHEMVVRIAGYDLHTAFFQPFAQSLCILHDLFSDTL